MVREDTDTQSPLTAAADVGFRPRTSSDWATQPKDSDDALNLLAASGVAIGGLTDHGILRANGTAAIQGSGVLLDDSNNITIPTDKKIYFRNTNTYIFGQSDTNLQLYASGALRMNSASFRIYCNAIQGSHAIDVIILGSTASAVNEVTIANNVAVGSISGLVLGDAPTISASGDSTNVHLALSGKGTGGVWAQRRFSVIHEGNSALCGFTYDSTGADYSGSCLFYRARGTIASPAAVVDGDRLGRFLANGRTSGGGWSGQAGVVFRVDGTPTSSVVPTEIQLVTANTVRLSIAHTGNIRVAGAGRIECTDANAYVYASSSGNLELNASAAVRIKTGATTLMTAGASGVGFWGHVLAAAPSFTVTNLTLSNTLNCDTCTTAELADVVGTILVAVLYGYGLTS